MNELAARPFSGFEDPAPAPRVRASLLDVGRVLCAYGGGALAGLLLLLAVTPHGSGFGAPATAMLERARALEQARLDSALALREIDEELADARVGR